MKLNVLNCLFIDLLEVNDPGLVLDGFQQAGDGEVPSAPDNAFG